MNFHAHSLISLFFFFFVFFFFFFCLSFPSLKPSLYPFIFLLLHLFSLVCVINNNNNNNNYTRRSRPPTTLERKRFGYKQHANRSTAGGGGGGGARENAPPIGAICHAFLSYSHFACSLAATAQSTTRGRGNYAIWWAGGPGFRCSERSEDATRAPRLTIKRSSQGQSV